MAGGESYFMGRYLRLIILISLVFFAIALISRWVGRQNESLQPQGLTLEIVASLQNIVTRSAEGIESFWSGYFYLVGAREENQKLHTTLDLARANLTALREAELANKRLKKLLDFKQSLEPPIIAGNVVASNPNAWFKTVVIDKGERDGLRTGQPVVTQNGAVGRVVELAPHYAKVLLLIDYNSSLDAMVQRTRVRGILAGNSTNICRLKYVLKHDDLVEGDVLITSGLGGVFPKGLKLGTVIRVKKMDHGLFLEVDVRPAVNFNKLEEVLIILKEEREL